MGNPRFLQWCSGWMGPGLLQPPRGASDVLKTSPIPLLQLYLFVDVIIQHTFHIFFCTGLMLYLVIERDIESGWFD